MKQLLNLILLAITISSSTSSCNKDNDKYEEIQFEFLIPLSISPGIDTIYIGQELILSANFSDSLFDVLSQKKYFLPDFKINTVAVIQKLTTPNYDVVQQPGAMNKFAFFNQVGTFSNFSSTFADVTFLFQNNEYKLIVKFTPKERGVFILNFFHDPGSKGSTKLPQELAPSEPGIKRFPLMRHIRYIFNNGQTHFSIYKDNCKPRDPNEATNWVESKATYTFVVK